MSVIMNYYRHMDRSKIQFDFLCFIPCEESYEKEIKHLGGGVFFIPKPEISIGGTAALRKFLSEHGTQYVCLHNHEVYLTFLLQPLARKSGIPYFIIHTHATKFSDSVPKAFRNGLLCLPIHVLKYQESSGVKCFACSRAAGTFLYGKRMVEEGKVHILPNAIDIEKFKFDRQIRRKIRREMKIENNFVIGHVGRFEAQKNHVFLIRVFQKLIRVRPDAKLLLIGSGSLENELLKLAKETLPEDTVFFLGECKNVSDLMQAMDVFVLPSFYEGLPVSCVEAQANGIPCIISENVSSEVRLNGNVYFENIRNIEPWVSRLQSQQFERVHTRLAATMYDIYSASEYLNNYYLKMATNGD